jgi:hypothetical protein
LSLHGPVLAFIAFAGVTNPRAQTLFSTDIVKFHGVDAPLYFSFSWMALAWFLGFMLIFGLMVFFWFKWLEGNARSLLEERRKQAMKGGWVPQRRIRVDEGDGEDRDSVTNGMMAGAVPIEGVPVGRLSRLSPFPTRESGKRSVRKSKDNGVMELASIPGTTRRRSRALAR